jgi:hypothetical protein
MTTEPINMFRPHLPTLRKNLSFGGGRPVAKLHSAGRYFLSRHCYRLAYASQSAWRPSPGGHLPPLSPTRFAPVRPPHERAGSASL